MLPPKVKYQKYPKQHQSMHILVSTQYGNTFIKCDIVHHSPRLDILLLEIPFAYSEENAKLRHGGILHLS